MVFTAVKISKKLQPKEALQEKQVFLTNQFLEIKLTHKVGS